MREAIKSRRQYRLQAIRLLALDILSDMGLYSRYRFISDAEAFLLTMLHLARTAEYEEPRLPIAPQLWLAFWKRPE